jgi:hypothetical protein
MSGDWVDRLREKQNSDRVRFRRYIAIVLVFYISAVAINAMALVVWFVLAAIGVAHVPYQSLAAWAVGSGGLGAGSLIFQRPMKHLWEDGPI